MANSESERAARLRALATQFRDFAANTQWPAYRVRMLEIAAETEHEAARIERESLENKPPVAAAS
jgi:hypothetical protein